jgi:FkbM family methyltransferase
MKFRSQFGEDEWLWRNAEMPRDGFFVEFGAMNGEYLSNTWWLEKSLGWSGLLCEPDPRQKILDRPGSIVERCAVGPAGTITLGLAEDDYGLSGVYNPSTKRVEVEQVPLTELLLKHSIERVDLISIDTEGTELEAWRTLDLRRWRPTHVIIEFVSWGVSDRSYEITRALTADGYSLIKTTRCNGIFVRSN